MSEDPSFSLPWLSSILINNVLTWPTSFGFLVSVISYCLMSPCSQLPKYKYLSSSEIRMSVIRPVERKPPRFDTFPQRSK